MQGVLEEALAAVLPEPVALTVAGRTDSGVHARGQVAGHPGSAAPAAALNAHLPDDVRVIASDEAHEGFDARRDALSRTYRYRVHTAPQASVFEHNRALHWRRPVVRPRWTCARRCCPARAISPPFTPTQTDHVRFERDVMRAEWVDEGEDVLAFDRGGTVHAPHGALPGGHHVGVASDAARLRRRSASPAGRPAPQRRR